MILDSKYYNLIIFIMYENYWVVMYVFLYYLKLSCDFLGMQYASQL